MKLYEDDKVVFEKFEDNTYRVTFFNDDNHWAGDITMSKKEGIIYNDVKTLKEEILDLIQNDESIKEAIFDAVINNNRFNRAIDDAVEYNEDGKA